MPSQFTLQVIDKYTGDVVLGFEPGSRVETDLVDDVLTRAKGEGIGLLRTEAAVEAALRRAWTETLLSLKTQVMPSRL
jgi:hypothetical protein